MVALASGSTASKPTVPAPPAPMTAAATARDDDLSDSDSDLEMVDLPGAAMRPQDYQVVFPVQGGPLSIKVQHSDIQDALQATIACLERKIVSEEAFPDAHKRGKGVRMAMVETVREMVPKNKYQALLTRFISDGRFIRSLSSIVSCHSLLTPGLH